MPNPLTQNSERSAATVVTTQTAIGQALSLRSRLGRFLWFVILLTLLFSKALVGLVIHAANSNLHSYILLVPIISTYLLYIRRSQLPTTYSSSPPLAAILSVAGLVALAFAVNLAGGGGSNDSLTLTVLAFVCLIAAGGFLFLGRKWMAAAAFPFAFLFFAVPIPDNLAAMLETGSKLASTEAADLFFNMTGTPVLREGTIFQLPDIVIQVGQECSGIRSSVVLVLTSLVGANLFLQNPWRRVALVAFVIPLGILRNGFRIWVIGTLCIDFGPQMVHSIIHRRGGPVFFTLSLIPFFVLLWWLHRGEERKQQTPKAIVR